MKKRILSLLLALVLVMQFGIVAFAEESNRETSADYYSEQETKTGKEALSVIDIERVAKHYADVQEKNGYEVVSATKQTVYVIDTLNDRGEVYNSRLMIVTEALQYKSDLKLKGNTWVGEDGETHQGGKLSIFLVVYKDSSRNYYAYGTADWENGVYSGGINGPAAGYDFLAITWGGGGELKNTDRSISGAYQYNQGNVGYLPQIFGAFRELTVYEVLEYFAELKGIPSNRQGKDIHDCLEDVNLWERHSDKVKTLSGGMIRRLGVAQALLGNPELILVDEPTAGLDPEERLRFKNLISQHREDCTILISTHIVEDVEALCDHIIILSHGKSICQDTPENIRKAAMKHVWHVSEKRQKELTSPYYILRREQIDGEAYLRVLSNEEQPGKSIQPTLEDGYINIIRGIR